MRVGVILASLGRPDDLGNILRHLKSQTQPPSAIVLSLEKPQDAPPELDPGVEVIFGPRGLCAQRNRGLDRILPHCDVVVFYDDDFVPTATSIEALSQLFEKNPDIVGATGKVLADGITVGGVEYPDAKSIIEAYEAQWPTVNPAPKIADVATAYGCNMAYRAGVMQDLRFDERLPLYGWQEDVDFAGRIRKRGRMVVTDAFAGVHCGVYRSRMPGRRVGFSQVVNPIYLMGKGSMRPSHAISQILKNVLSNHVKAIRPEWYMDRKGRAVGNWLGVAHLLSGRADPMAVLDIDPGSAKALADPVRPKNQRT